MGNKEKGSKAERELYDMFVSNGYRAVRVAGSGVMEETACDLIAGKKGGRKYSVEVKASKTTSKYISKSQIEQLMIFSEIYLEIFLDLPVAAEEENLEGKGAWEKTLLISLISPLKRLPLEKLLL